MSKARIEDCTFDNSGNDAIDLMDTRAVVINSRLVNNGDKGISVGEGSRLFAANNSIQDNVFGIQSKDGSVAVLTNQTIQNNQTALDTYKKNWQYGDGGTIIANKSVFSDNQTLATADKDSKIIVFDSYADIGSPGRNIQFIDSDLGNMNGALSSNPLPDNGILLQKDLSVLTDFEAEIKEFTHETKRGQDPAGGSPSRRRWAGQRAGPHDGALLAPQLSPPAQRLRGR